MWLPETNKSNAADFDDFEVSTEFFLDSFAICYSEQGCNKRTAEEAVILHWNDYVTDCEGK